MQKSKQQEQIGYGVHPRNNCPHVKSQWIDSFFQVMDVLGQSIYPGVCKDCQDKSENWICLPCSIVYCSRYVKGHMAQHNKDTKHPIAFSFSDGSYWCYDCDDYITNMRLNLARNKFATLKFPNGDDSDEMDRLTDVFKKQLVIDEKQKKESQFTYQKLINGLRDKQYKKVVFLTGAGISVSSGIPDFRTPGTGLYSKLEKYNLPIPQAVFAIDYFRVKPEPFYKLSKEFFSAQTHPSIAHKFIKKMNDQGLLSIALTQNIDGLQITAGLPLNKLFQAHGHNRSARCIDCQKEVDIKLMNNAIETETILHCAECNGLIKPDIVFFGEGLPKQFEKCPQQVAQADLVIIAGTSLVVFPFAYLTSYFGENAHIVLINNTNSLGIRKNSLWLDGNLDNRFAQIAKDLKWEIV